MAGELSAFLGGFTGSTIGAAVVNLYLDSKQYNAELAASQAKLGAATTGMGGKLAAFKTVGATAFAGLGAAALVFGAKSVQAAGDQEEALNKVREIFDASSSEVERFATTTDRSLGISETAALSAAGTFGNLFTNVGFATDEAAKMSTGLVSLAGDLASFNNIDPTEALEKLRAGLAGEAEPLRAVGVFLSEGKVQSEAYASGIAEVGTELTDQQKIQARYNIILEETEQAQGDFARTSDSLANQQRRLGAEIENLQADIGEGLVPVVADAVGLFADLLDVIDKLRDQIGEGAGSGISASVESSTNILASNVGAWNDVRQAVSDFLNAGDEVPDNAAGIANAGGVVTDALGGATDALNQTARALGRTGGGFERFAGLTGEALQDWRDDVIENIRDTFGTISEFDNQWTISARQFKRNADRMATQAEQFTDDLKVLKDLDLAESIEQALLEEGPAAVHAFVDANREGKNQIVDDLHASQREFKEQRDLIEEMTGKVDKLDGKSARATVEVEYKVVGKTDPRDLPGLGN